MGAVHRGTLPVSDLIGLQLEIERIAITSADSLVRLPGDDPDEIPALAVHRWAGGYRLVFAEEVSPADRAALRALDVEAAFDDVTTVSSILGPIRRDQFATYTFVQEPAGDEYRGVVAEPAGFAIYEGGVRAAWAFSSREGPSAAELAVETLPQFRRRGFARRAASAWAAAKMDLGKVAFYTHAADNVPSQRLAASLGVTWAFDVVTYARKRDGA